MEATRNLNRCGRMVITINIHGIIGPFFYTIYLEFIQGLKTIYQLTIRLRARDFYEVVGYHLIEIKSE